MRYFFCLTAFIMVNEAPAQDSLKTQNLEEVVITGQFEPQSLKQSVYQVRTISRETIQKRSATNIQTLLNTELGIRFSNDLTLGTADISLMGMGGQNVKILLDGVPLVDRGATKESLNQIDVRGIERIEIVEGPMSVSYGSDALAGVINIITKKHADGINRFSVDTNVQEETAGDEYEVIKGAGIHNENIAVVWRGSKLDATATVTRNQSGGWRESRLTDPSLREWHPKKQWLSMGAIGFKAERFNMDYKMNFTNETILSEENTYTDINTNTLMAVDREYITNRFTHILQSEWQYNEQWTFNGVLSYQDYTRKTQTTSINLANGDRRLYLNEAGAQDVSQFQSEVIRLTSVYKCNSAVSIQTGIDINLNTGFGDRIDGKRSIRDYALFVSSELNPLKKVSIRPGLRFIYNSVYDAPPVIPSLNMKWAMSKKVDIRFAYGYGFRAPSLRELYFLFHDASHDIEGNPYLRAEYSHSVTGSVTWRIHNTTNIKVESTLGVFYNRFENMIALGNSDPQNPAKYTYINILKNRTTGFTWSNVLRLKNLQASAGIAFIGTFNQLSASDYSLPAFMWSPEVNGTVSYRIEKMGLHISAFYKYTGSRSSYSTVQQNGGQAIQLGKVDGFHWMDVTLLKNITRLFDVSGGVKNIFDVQQVASSISAGAVHSNSGPIAVGYGRSYFISVNFHISQ